MSTAAPSVTVSTELTVTGMTCGNCVRHVREALDELAGVRAEVDLAAGTATVAHPASVTAQDLVEAIAEAGYDASVREPGRR